MKPLNKDFVSGLYKQLNETSLEEMEKKMSSEFQQFRVMKKIAGEVDEATFLKFALDREIPAIKLGTTELESLQGGRDPIAQGIYNLGRWFSANKDEILRILDN